MHAIKTTIEAVSLRKTMLHATCPSPCAGEGLSIYVEYNHQLTPLDNHKGACEEAMRVLKLDQLGPMVGGIHGSSYYWVLANGDSPRAWCSF